MAHSQSDGQRAVEVEAVVAGHDRRLAAEARHIQRAIHLRACPAVMSVRQISREETGPQRISYRPASRQQQPRNVVSQHATARVASACTSGHYATNSCTSIMDACGRLKMHAGQEEPVSHACRLSRHTSRSRSPPKRPLPSCGILNGLCPWLALSASSACDMLYSSAAYVICVPCCSIACACTPL